MRAASSTNVPAEIALSWSLLPAIDSGALSIMPAPNASAPATGSSLMASMKPAWHADSASTNSPV
ncbi:hypothetical protein D3C77_800770 [compost metagenome]